MSDDTVSGFNANIGLILVVATLKSRLCRRALQLTLKLDHRHP